MSSSNKLISVPLLLIATNMLAIGGIAIYRPEILELYLPNYLLHYFSQYSWLAMALCAGGLSLHMMILLLKLMRPSSRMVRSFKELDEPQQPDCPTLQQPVRGPIKTANVKVSRLYSSKLVRKDSDIIKVKASAQSLFFLVVLLIASVGAGAMLCLEMMELRTVEDALFTALLSGGFFLIGLFSLYKFAQPMVFDRQSGYFWHGYLANKKPNMVFKDAKPLTRIHALQVLSGKSNRSGYELNLVLTDRSRINLMEHVCPRTLNINARRLSEFLNVPVWQ